MMLARLDMEIFSEVVILPAATSLSASFTFSIAACVKEGGLKIQPINSPNFISLYVMYGLVNCLKAHLRDSMSVRMLTKLYYSLSL